MKVIALNSSPHMERGNTALILAPFLEGLRTAGAEVELLYTGQMNIAPCQGEFDCWIRTPGICRQRDDMQMLEPRFREADIWVLASPVYVWGVNGPMKNVLDRLLPLLDPHIDMRQGHCSHPLRCAGKRHRLVLVSSCGFWEMDNFDPLLAQCEMLCRILDLEFAGALLRPHAPALAGMLSAGAPVDDVLAAAQEAGRQVVLTGEVPAELFETVGRELMPLAAYVQLVNSRIDLRLKRIMARAANAG